MAHKLLQNSTGVPLSVSLLVRSGADPGKVAEIKAVNLAPGEKEEVSYGTSSDIYLDGLRMSWSGGDTGAYEQRVQQRGDAWDNLLNKNTNLEFKSLPAASIGASG